MQALEDPALIRDPNYVKVAVDASWNALLFSRSPIPFVRDPSASPTFWEHIGVYAFRREALLAFARLPAGPLERAEKIECLRFLEHGYRMRMVPTAYMGVEIDTPQDLVRAERLLAGTGGTP
jgi:CMP-2-keto-3-deoxyoctulosonic acid synthetase